MECERTKRAGSAGIDDPEDMRDVVRSLMERIVAGDGDAVWELHAVAEPALAAILRGEARRIDVHLDGDDLLDLTLDAAVDLARLAPAWRAEGALPWVWAKRRITALVHQHVGTFARPLDESHLELEEPPVVARVEEPRRVLRSLAGRHPSARHLDERLSATVSDRDADIWLGVELERSGGNRSPAVTVGTDHGLRPEAVRKVVQRVRERLGEVA